MQAIQGKLPINFNQIRAGDRCVFGDERKREFGGGGGDGGIERIVVEVVADGGIDRRRFERRDAEAGVFENRFRPAQKAAREFDSAFTFENRRLPQHDRRNVNKTAAGFGVFKGGEGFSGQFAPFAEREPNNRVRVGDEDAHR